MQRPAEAAAIDAKVKAIRDNLDVRISEPTSKP